MTDEFSDLLDVIGSGAASNGDVEKARRLAADGRGVIHPLVGRDVLGQASPKPSVGKSDQTYPELGIGEPLFIPRYLVKEWGWEKSEGSAYHQLWKVEAARTFAGRDPLPSEHKKGTPR